MKVIAWFLATVFCASALEPGFTPLFNGRDLKGWKKVGGNGEYAVENGEIIGRGEKIKHNTFLRSEQIFKNFDFRFEMKFETLEGNSGMMIRGSQRPGENGWVYGYQCEHDNDVKRCWTGGLYYEGSPRGWLVPDKKNAEQTKSFTAANQKRFKTSDWNEIRVVCEGKRIRIWLNGEQTVDFTDEHPDAILEGFFGMQVHAGQVCHVRWRNLRVKELPQS